MARLPSSSGSCWKDDGAPQPAFNSATLRAARVAASGCDGAIHVTEGRAKSTIAAAPRPVCGRTWSEPATAPYEHAVVDRVGPLSLVRAIRRPLAPLASASTTATSSSGTTRTSLQPPSSTLNDTADTDRSIDRYDHSPELRPRASVGTHQTRNETMDHVPSFRVGAALALRISGESPARIRVAAESVLSEPLREALLATAEGDDERLELALRRMKP